MEWTLTGKGGSPIYLLSDPLEDTILVSQKVCVPGGEELEFKIEDEYGDGICCRYDSGYYIIKTDCETIKEGGQYNNLELLNFKAPHNKANKYGFENLFTGTFTQYAEDIKQTCDGVYILTGVDENNSMGGYDIRLSKLDAYGSIQWNKHYGTSQNDLGKHIIETIDENYVIAAQIRDFQSTWSKAYAIKVDANGDTIWTRLIGNTSTYRWFTDVVQTYDNGFAFVGGIGNTGSLNVYPVKLDQYCNFVWEKSLGDAIDQSGTSIVEDISHNLILLAINDDTDSDIRVYKTNSSGTLITTKTYSNESYNDYAYSTAKTNDNGYIIGAYSAISKFESYIYLLKLNASIDTLWTKIFINTEYEDYIYDIIVDSDNNFILTGQGAIKVAPGNWDYPLFVYSFNQSGDTNWTRSFSKVSTSANGNAISQTGDGGYIVVGAESSARRSDMYVLKLRPNGQLDAVYQNEEICMVRVDEKTGKNMIVWEKTPGEGTISYNIYREGNVIGQYEFIGNRPYDNLSIFIDNTSNPKTKSYRYKLSAVNSFGTESRLSPEHKTMHLTVNIGQDNAINLLWDAYEGFNLTTYNVYRGTSWGTMSLIASLPANLTSFTDLTPPQGVKVFYFISVIKESACSPQVGRLKSTSGPFSQSISNLEDNRLKDTDIDDVNQIISTIEVHPNPVFDDAIIDFTLDAESLVNIALNDITGRTLQIIENKMLKLGEHHINIDLSGYNPGVYYLIINTKGETTSKKIIKM